LEFIAMSNEEKKPGFVLAKDDAIYFVRAVKHNEMIHIGPQSIAETNKLCKDLKAEFPAWSFAAGRMHLADTFREIARRKGGSDDTGQDQEVSS
jgi:hypothetical protein